MMQLSLVSVLNISNEIQAENSRNRKLMELFDYWEHAEKLSAEFTIEGKKHVGPYTLAPPAFLGHIVPGEVFGLYAGNMMLVSSELARERPNWLPYVVAKLYMERFVDQGLDESGLVKHYISLFGMIRWAGVSLPPAEAHEMILLTARRDQSRYFELDKEVRNLLERWGGNPSGILQDRRDFLERHHYNRWVRQGRLEEEFRQTWSVGFSGDGFRNHAEAIYNYLVGSKLDKLYLVTDFVRMMITLEPGQRLILQPPYGQYAFVLTKAVNGVVDLVRFIEASDEHGRLVDVIEKVPGKDRTWRALLERLCFTTHRAEIGVQKLIAERREELQARISEAAADAENFENRLAVLRQPESLFAETVQNLAALSGDWSSEVQELSELCGKISRNVRQLDEAAGVLRQAI